MSGTEQEFSFKNYFVPMTSARAITWIIITGLLVYFLSFFNGFVWDDFPQYVNNTATHSLSQFFQILSNRNMTYYRPFPAVVFAAIYMIVGATAFWYHLLQVLLHISNTILIFLLFKKFLPRTYSFFLSLIFLIHPMQVESVVYISSLQTVLSLFFGLLCFFLIENKRLVQVYKYGLVFICLLLSVLSKETGWLFFLFIPAFMLLEKKAFHRKDYYAFITVCLLIISIYSLLEFIFPASPAAGTSPPVPVMRAGLPVRLTTLPAVIFYYLYTFIFPKDLSVSQQWLVTGFNLQHFVIPLFFDILIFTGILVSALFIRKKNHKLYGPYIFFSLWFFFSFAIVWQFIPLDMTVADRWFYFPMTGLLGMSGVLVLMTRDFWYKYRNMLLYILSVLIIILSIRTAVRITNWHDGITLFMHDQYVSYQSYDLFNELGYNYLLAGEYDLAKPNLDRSLRLAPDYWVTWDNLGVYYENKKQISNSKAAFLKAIAINSQYYPSYINLTRLYYYYGKFADEEKFLSTKALVKFPGDPYLWSVKGVVDYRTGEKRSGIQEVQKAYNLSHQTFYLQLENLMQQNKNLTNLQ